MKRRILDKDTSIFEDHGNTLMGFERNRGIYIWKYIL